MTTNYETRYYHPDDEPQVLDLLRISLGEPDQRRRTSEFWRWKHMDNPFGPSLIRVAVDPAGNIIGLRAFLRWRFRRGNELIHAVRPVDTATHPDHQRRGIFARLTTEAVADAREQGVTLIFNTPNPQSLAGYLKLGWHVVGKVRPLIKVLNPPRFALGLAKHRLGIGRPHPPYPLESFFKGDPPPHVSEALRSLGNTTPPEANPQPSLVNPTPSLENPTPSLSNVSDYDLKSDTSDIFWTYFLRTRLHTDRTPEYLRWRYADHPTISYRALYGRENDPSSGFAIIRTNTRYGLREIVISDMIIRQSDTFSLPRAHYLAAFYPVGSTQRRWLTSCGFRTIPLGGMTLAANEIGPSPAKLSSLDEWGITLGDLEFF